MLRLRLHRAREQAHAQRCASPISVEFLLIIKDLDMARSSCALASLRRRFENPGELTGNISQRSRVLKATFQEPRSLSSHCQSCRIGTDYEAVLALLAKDREPSPALRGPRRPVEGHPPAWFDH